MALVVVAGVSGLSSIQSTQLIDQWTPSEWGAGEYLAQCN